MHGVMAERRTVAQARTDSRGGPEGTPAERSHIRMREVSRGHDSEIRFERSRGCVSQMIRAASGRRSNSRGTRHARHTVFHVKHR